VTLANSDGNILTGNRIGTNAAGTAGMGNAGTGLVMNASDGNTIGGAAPGAGNIISDNDGQGVHLHGDSDDNTFLGNLIGVGADGTTALGNGSTCGCAGFWLQGGDRNTVGGVGAGEANVVANNEDEGVAVETGDRNAIRGNSIHSNGGVELDLYPSYGVTPNDPVDSDGGANRLQNFPDLTSAGANLAGTQVKGSLSSKPSTAYTIDFYSSPTCDTSGNGGGSTYLGSTPVVTNGAGTVSFTASLSVSAATGSSVTATATDPFGRTSEFSECEAPTAMPTVSLSPLAPTPSEAVGTAGFTVALSGPSSETVTVDWQTADGTAVAATDYTGQAPTTLTFTPGQTSKPISVAITGDTIDEDDETFSVSLSHPDNTLVASGSGTSAVTIVDDDALPTINVANSLDVVETGGDTQTFSVTLSHPSSKTVTVTAATDDGTAATPTDYTGVGELLTFLPGQTSKTVNVTVLDDLIDEANESYAVNVHGPTNAVIGTASGTGTIIDDDTDPTIDVTPVDPSVGEGAGPAAFTVTLSQASAKTVTVSWSTSHGTATGADYTGQSPTMLTFNPGQTSKPISVPITNDTLDEANETFVVSLSSPSESYIGTGSTTVTITDDDATPTLSVSDASDVAEVSGGVVQGYTVTLSAASGQTVQVAAATAGGTASEGNDYQAQSQTVTFLPGETSKNVNVNVLDDFDGEPTESYEVRLSSAVNATVSDGTGSGSITDDDVYPTVSIAATNSPVTEGSAASFTATLSGAYGAPVTVTYQTNDGTATAGSDYTGHAPTVLTFNPGETSKPISVIGSSDILDEDDETFSVTLSSPSRAILGAASATATITDNDATPSVSVANPTNRAEGTGGNLQTTTVSLSAASGRPVSVVVATVAVNAIADADYTTKAVLMTFTPGQVSLPFTVSVIDDTVDEGADQYQVRLFTPSNASLGTHTATATITDNDAAPTISIGDANLVEPNAGQPKASLFLPLTLSTASEREIKVAINTADVTATAGGDYDGLIGKVITLPAGATTANVKVQVRGDNVDEPDETFNANVSVVQFVTIADGVGVGAILDND
jgi:hypothetical protein